MADKIVIEVVGNTAGLKSLTDEFNKTAKASDELNKKLLETEKEADKADKAFKSLKTQIKEAKVEAQAMAEKFGASSKEATSAAQKVAQLTDDLDDFNNRVKALNPEAKFTALTNVLSGTLGAFQGVTGAVQLFGGESKKAQEIAQKLQGALNFAQGLNSLMGMKDAFKDLQVVLGITSAATTTAAVANQELAVAEGEAAVASGALNASLLANPAFLIITSIVALGGAIYALSGDAEEATIKINELTEGQLALRDSTNDASAAYDRMRIAIGTIDDFTEKRNALDREYNTQLYENDVAVQKSNKTLQEQKKLYDELYQSKLAASAANPVMALGGLFTGPSDKELADAKEKYDQAQKDYEGFTKQKTQIDLAYQFNKQAIDEEGNNKEEEERKKNAEKRKADAEKALAQKKADFQAEMNLIKLRQQNLVNDESDPAKKLELQQKFAVENYALEKNFLENNKGTALELKTLWEQYYGTRSNLSAQQDKITQASCEKELAEEQKLIDAKIALRLKQEADPVKQAQIEMDALDDKYAKILSNEKLTATERERINAEYQLKQLEITDKVTKAVVDSEKAKQDAQQKTAEDAEKNAEKRLATELAVKDAIVGAASSFADIGLDITRQQLSAEEQALKEQKDKGLINEEQYQKKLNEIKHKADVADKQAAIFKATLDFAAALINALKAPPTAIPAVLALTTAVAGANLAKIIATPLPKYQKGTLSVPGVDMGRDSVMAMLQPGEAVIPTAINRKYAPTIRAIYEQKISASDINSFVRGKKNGANGDIVATVDTYALSRAMSKNRNVTVENAQTIGKVIANEIGSRLNNRYII
jgi:hypothetical protein